MCANRRSIISIAFGISAILLITFIIAYLQHPKAVILKSSHKLFVNDTIGDVQVVTDSFQILNIGLKPLQILNVKSSCGCTIAHRPNDISPWRMGEIKCKMTFGSNDIVRTVELLCETNEKPARIHRLELKAIAVNHHSVMPSQLDLGTTLQGERCQGNFSIMMPKAGHVKEIYDTENAYKYQTSYQNVADDDIASSVALVQVQMELMKNDPGDFQSNISIILENGNRLSLPVRWTITPARGFILNEVCFGVVRNNLVSNASVRFRDRFNLKNIAQIKVSSETDWCSVTQVQIEKQNVVRIDLTAQNTSSKKGRLRGTLLVECYDGACFRLPISAIGM